MTEAQRLEEVAKLQTTLDEWRLHKQQLQALSTHEGWKFLIDQMRVQVKLKQQELLDLDAGGQGFAHVVAVKKGELQGLQLGVKMLTFLTEIADEEMEQLRRAILELEGAESDAS